MNLKLHTKPWDYDVKEGSKVASSDCYKVELN